MEVALKGLVGLPNGPLGPDCPTSAPTTWSFLLKFKREKTTEQWEKDGSGSQICD